MVAVVMMFLLVSYVIYQHYVPVKVKQQSLSLSNDDEAVILDLRSYQDAAKEPFEDACNIPYPYIKRHYHQLPSRHLYVIAPDWVSKNVSIRFLKRKGLNVKGYSIMNDFS
ncbi:hypothetical protein [Texcoconibacillus texcoconensis]|nr:hypothetical protein [Texcoconibacillus texcoconensis]